MDTLELTSELCGICESLLHIVEGQRDILAQYDALAWEGEIEAARSRYNAAVGRAQNG